MEPHRILGMSSPHLPSSPFQATREKDELAAKLAEAELQQQLLRNQAETIAEDRRRAETARERLQVSQVRLRDGRPSRALAADSAWHLLRILGRTRLA